MTAQLSSCLSRTGMHVASYQGRHPAVRHRPAVYCAVPSCLFMCVIYHYLPQVGRYSSFYVVNNLVPIVLSTCLGFFVFLLDGDDMEKRLSECLRLCQNLCSYMYIHVQLSVPLRATVIVAGMKTLH